jgi:CheY-like chemotaxis protein
MDGVPPTEPTVVLVADDEPLVRDLVCEMLDEEGFEVLCAASGSEALQLAREHEGRIDLLLADVSIPDMSGRELAKRVAVDHPETRFLYMSGRPDDELLDDFGVIGAERHFLAKPFRRKELILRVAADLGR